jgi:putative transposase
MTLPPDNADFPGRWKRIKSLFTRHAIARGVVCERNERGEYALWQRRFWEHTVRNESDFARHVDYIHYNPLKHGLVSRLSDWRHSSFHRYVKRGVLPKDWAGVAAGHSGFGERDG